MTREDFVYGLENAGIIHCIRDDNNKIDVEETIKSDDFKRGCWSPYGERLSCKEIYNIIDDLGGFDDD